MTEKVTATGGKLTRFGGFTVFGNMFIEGFNEMDWVKMVGSVVGMLGILVWSYRNDTKITKENDS